LATLDPRLGLDSISFPTFGWEQVVDEPTERAWKSDHGTLLSVHYFGLVPDLPSLDIDPLTEMYGTRRLDDDSRPFLIELAVESSRTPPLVRVVTRQHIPERERYGFQAALLAPVATCSWVVKAARLEGNTTGVRETIAFDDYARAHPDRIKAGPPWPGFDPYTRERDDQVPDGFDPLSAVRRCIDDVEAALTFRDEVLSEPPFAPTP